MTDAVAALRRAEALRQMHRPQEAADACRAALAEHPDHPALLRGLALAQRDCGDRKAAVRTIDLAIGAAPADADNHRVRAALLTGKSMRGAVSSAREAVRLAPHSMIARYTLVRALIAALRRREAQRVADAMAVDAPTSPLSRHALAEVATARRRHDAAIRMYREILAENPADAPAHNNLGRALLRAGRRQEAAVEFAHHAEANPTSATARRNLWRSTLPSFGIVGALVAVQLYHYTSDTGSGTRLVVSVVALFAGLAVGALILGTRHRASRLTGGAATFLHVESRRRMRRIAAPMAVWLLAWVLAVAAGDANVGSAAAGVALVAACVAAALFQRPAA